MSSSRNSGTLNVLAIGVTPEEKRHWFPVVTGLSVCTTGSELPGRVNAGLGKINCLLLGGELTESQARTLRRKAQEKGVRFYGPTDGCDLGRFAHRLFGLNPPACRTEDQAKEQCQQLALEAWAEADELKKQLAALKPAEIAALRRDIATAQARIAALVGDLQGCRGESEQLALSLADSRSNEASATARAEELHGQLETARIGLARLREEKEEGDRELGRAREGLAGLKAQLDEARAETSRVRAEAEAKVRAAQDRSSEDWRAAVLAQDREPALRDQLDGLRKANESMRAEKRADQARIRELEGAVKAGEEAIAELARIRAGLEAVFVAEAVKRKKK